MFSGSFISIRLKPRSLICCFLFLYMFLSFITSSLFIIQIYDKTKQQQALNSWLSHVTSGFWPLSLLSFGLVSPFFISFLCCFSIFAVFF